MKRVPTHLTLIPLLLLTLASMLWAQAEPPMPKPGPLGPGHKVTVTDHNEMLGDFFVVFHRKGRGPKGSGKEIGFLGYAPEQKVYTYEVFSDDGSVGRAAATISGDTWVLLAPAIDTCRQGGDKEKERFTLKEVSPTSYTFIGEVSIDGGPWTRVDEGKATRSEAIS